MASVSWKQRRRAPLFMVLIVVGDDDSTHSPPHKEFQLSTIPKFGTAALFGWCLLFVNLASRRSQRTIAHIVPFSLKPPRHGRQKTLSRFCWWIVKINTRLLIFQESEVACFAKVRWALHHLCTDSGRMMIERRLSWHQP